ncbi:MAG: hypothetical protein NT037_14735 [Hyphomicrobiales bacterium]|nr:hypothetical protein [Hyphomicrobiales bacterium]
MIRLTAGRLAALMLAALPAFGGAQAQSGLVPTLPSTTPGIQGQPITPIPPPIQSPVPPFQPLPGPSQRYVPPICQIPVQSRSPDLRAYCAANGQ